MIYDAWEAVASIGWKKQVKHCHKFSLRNNTLHCYSCKIWQCKTQTQPSSVTRQAKHGWSSPRKNKITFNSMPPKNSRPWHNWQPQSWHLHKNCIQQLRSVTGQKRTSQFHLMLTLFWMTQPGDVLIIWSNRKIALRGRQWFFTQKQSSAWPLQYTSLCRIWIPRSQEQIP